MASYTYTGDVPRTYPNHLDVTDPAKRRTLVAEPGEAYVIEPAAGHTLPNAKGAPVPFTPLVPPDDGLWKPARVKSEKKDS